MPVGLAIPDGIDVVTITPLASRDAYSRFVLKDLLPLVRTSHALLVQWDGYVVNPEAWSPAFLECDYLGATWFWRDDDLRVGNGGFSLRSRRLLEALQNPKIEMMEAEDITIGRTYRRLLEREHGIRFGDESLADRFSFETDYPAGKPFGFHGLFNFWRVVPPAELRTLPAQFSYAVARSPQLDQLMHNCLVARMWAQGAAVARRILAADPGNAEVKAILADVTPRIDPARMDRPPRALAADEYVERGNRFNAAGDLDSAGREYRAALALEPGLLSALRQLAAIEHRRGRVEVARELLARAQSAREL
jgi:tetratricopeptide (TPR) repeat protein